MSEEFTIQEAVRSSVGLFIGIGGGTGSGKTYTAMRIAKGIVGEGKRFGVVDTENKRASHYADEFEFDVINFEAPFSSERYERAVSQLFKAGYGAIIVDSASHEHDGYGGYLDSQTSDLETRVKRYLTKYPNENEFKAIEKLTPSSWIEPKLHRKRMMQTLLSCSSTVPIIFCFRSEEKVFASKDGKLVARAVPEWEPICGKGLPFEMTVFLMLHHDKPGIISKAIKLPEKLKHMFPSNEQLGEKSGVLVAEWARGTSSKQPAEVPPQGNVESQKPTPEVTPNRYAEPDIPIEPSAKPTEDQLFAQIKSVDEREWSSGGKKGKVYFVTTVSGSSYGTYSESLSKLAKESIGKGLVLITHKPGKKQGTRELVSVGEAA